MAKLPSAGEDVVDVGGVTFCDGGVLGAGAAVCDPEYGLPNKRGRIVLAATIEPAPIAIIPQRTPGRGRRPGPADELGDELVGAGGPACGI